MSDCCTTKEQVSEKSGFELCSNCKVKGKTVKIITLKSMLKPSALETFNIKENYYFCSTKDCNVVYFDRNNKKYLVSDIKVPVHQKDNSTTTPICYCFDWTKEKINLYVEKGLALNPVDHIRENINENRCGCEVNNPQGSCCLGNVIGYIRELT
jgi:hypothetical protein